MKRRKLTKLLITGLCLTTITSAHTQNSMENRIEDRKPVVAGSFYPADPSELKTQVTRFLAEAAGKSASGTTRAILVPHAGYVFSGSVAASGFTQIDASFPYKRIFILASSHRMSLGKASVYTRGNYRTPLGTVPVDIEVSKKLAATGKVFTDEPAAHLQEHSIEVQLPFIQLHFEKPVPIVPIVVATQVPGICEEIAEVLKPWFTPENLFIVSADFSHYPSYENANKVDALTAEAFCRNSVADFLSTLKANEQKKIPELATSMCAWPSALILLKLTEGQDLNFRRVEYKNSGDSKGYGDKSAVVGYHAISISEPADQAFHLTPTDKKELLSIARTTLQSWVQDRKIPKTNPAGFSKSLQSPCGAFVTLRKDGQLRGCIGSFEPTLPLYRVIQEMTVSSSSHDSRFLPVEPDELRKIHIEISVLTPMRKISDIKEIRLGTHGIYICKGSAGGTFLPQVATETGWTLEEFLGHCARDKAGIGWEGWKNAEIFIYEAIIFEEELPVK